MHASRSEWLFLIKTTLVVQCTLARPNETLANRREPQGPRRPCGHTSLDEDCACAAGPWPRDAGAVSIWMNCRDLGGKHETRSIAQGPMTLDPITVRH